MLINIIAASNLHILLLLVTNELQISKFYNTPHKHKLSTFRNMPCNVPVLFSEMYYSHNCIFTATTIEESCSCPHYRRYTANSIPIDALLSWLLSSFPRKYSRHCPHYRSNYHGNRGITAIRIPISLFNLNVMQQTSFPLHHSHYH